MLVSLRGGIQNIQADAAILKIASQKTLAMTRRTRVPERFLRGLSSPPPFLKGDRGGFFWC
jgi:hypothetical protein